MKEFAEKQAMNDPILSYDTENERLQLDFDDWTIAQISSIQQMLICWGRRGTSLYSVPVKLAKQELLEVLPNTVLDASVLDLDIYAGNGQAISDPNLFMEQVEPTNLLYSRDNAILMAAPGLGKTIMAIVALRERYHHLAVIVAPLSSLDSWRKELEVWYCGHEDQLIKDVQIWRKLPDNFKYNEFVDRQVIVMSPQTMVKLVESNRLDELLDDENKADQILILDETFLYKNRKANRQNAASDLASYFGVKWMLSGMPVSRFSDDLFAQLKILFPSVFRSYWKFAARYCLLEQSQWGTKIVADKPGAIERLKSDLSDILIDCDYPEHIPDWTPHVIDCPMTDFQEKIYATLKKELAVKAEVLGSDKPLTLKTILSLTGRLLQVASNPLLLRGADESGKWDRLYEVLVQNEGPFLLWVNYIDTAEILRHRLAMRGYRVAKLVGETKSEDRQSVVDAFQRGEIDVLLIHPGVGKYSHTLTACRTSIYLERSFNGEDFYQSLFRVRRIVSKHSVKVLYMLSVHPDGSQTIDGIVHKILLDRGKNAQKLTVGQLIGSI